MSPLLTDGFATREKQGGKPAILFTFAIGTRTWRYVQGTRDVTVAATGLTYTAAHMQVDSDVERRDEVGPQRIAVKMGIRTDVVAALREAQTERKYLGIHRYHASVGGTPARWAFGEIASGTVKRGWYTVELETLEATFEGSVPRAVFAPQCQKTTYSPECGLNADDFAFGTNIILVDGRTVTVDSVGGQPDDYYTDGLLKIGASWYNISKQTGTSLKLFQTPRNLTLPESVTIYAGDDLQHETCRDKFNNLDKFLGWKWLPSKNPSLDLEHRGPDILVTTYEAPTPGGYVRPSKWIWLRGDTPIGSPPTDFDPNMSVDGVHQSVASWTDESGNGRDCPQSYLPFEPGYLFPTRGLVQSPWAESEGVGFGGVYREFGGTTDGNTRYQLDFPDWLGLTGCDFYYTIRLDNDDPPKPIELFYITGDGNGQGVTAILPGRMLQVGLALGGTGRFYIPLPNWATVNRDIVLNISAMPDRYSVRIDNVLIFTTTPNESYYGLSFYGGNALGGEMNAVDSSYVARRLVVYPDAVLSKEDRASTYAYMKTGIGVPV